MKLHYAADIEVYPNFFCGCFTCIETGSDKTFIYYEENGKTVRDDRKKLKAFLKTSAVFIGFNFISYDMPVLLKIANEDWLSVFPFSDRIITRQTDKDYYDYLNLAKEKEIIDLMEMLALNEKGVGLKQVGIILKWPRLQELPIPPGTYVTREQARVLVKYCFNDVGITARFYKSVQNQIEVRKWASKSYKLDLLNASDSKMANLILTKLYGKATGQTAKQLRHQKTDREQIALVDCIPSHIKFETPEFRNFLSELKGSVLTEKDKQGKFSFKRKVYFKGKRYDIGVGGLHSKDEPGVFCSTDDTIIVDADVSSFYPYIILNNELCPAHLDKNKFLKIYRRIVEDRISAKKLGDFLKAQVLKITLNSVFGKLGSPHFWLYDLLTFYSVTVAGQLYLLMFIEMLVDAGFEVISANTDGVVTKVPRKDYDKYKLVCGNWERITDFQLEFTEYEKYVRRDVNSYTTKTTNGKVKDKGIFVVIDPDEAKDIGMIIAKRYNKPIVAKSLKRYFLEGIPVEETVRGSEDIYDFIDTHIPGKKFKVYLRKGQNLTKQQRINRYYMARTGVESLIKIDPSTNKEYVFLADHSTTVVNDIDETEPIEEYNIDYEYYIKEIQKIISIIKPKSVKRMMF